MASLNKVLLIGNVGKDPEMKHLDNGSKIVKFSLATHESYKGKNGTREEQTEWHNIVILREGLAEIAEKYLNKGKQIYIEGRIRTRNWTDKEGVRKNATEIIAENFIMLGKKRTEGGGENENNEIDHVSEAPAINNEGPSNMPF